MHCIGAGLVYHKKLLYYALLATIILGFIARHV